MGGQFKARSKKTAEGGRRRRRRMRGGGSNRTDESIRIPKDAHVKPFSDMK
jgi:hypothetical protein